MRCSMSSRLTCRPSIANSFFPQGPSANQPGEMDVAFALAITIWGAHQGSEDYPEPVSDLRIVAPLYPNMTHVLVAPGSGVETFSDVAGKRLAVEVNEEVVPRSEHGEYCLRDGDRVEIVHAIGGG